MTTLLTTTALGKYGCLMRIITIPSSAIILRSDQPLTPAMVSAVWEIAAAVDKLRLRDRIDDALWLEIPTAHLRGAGSRSDNVWLRECLDRLTGIKLSGEDQGDPWGAVVLAEWRIIHAGKTARLLIPPAGVNAFRAPAIFTKIEATAAHRLTGHARQLYALLSDKKRQDRPYWSYSLHEIKALMGVSDRASYSRFNSFRQRVLDPAVQAINDYGTVAVTMTTEKIGREVVGVRFAWEWKDPHAAARTLVENERHSSSRRKAQETTDAPPMIEDVAPQPAAAKSAPQADAREVALIWWKLLPPAEQSRWADKIGREVNLGLGVHPRPERTIAQLAYEMLQNGGAAPPSEQAQ